MSSDVSTLEFNDWETEIVTVLETKFRDASHQELSGHLLQLAWKVYHLDPAVYGTKQ